MNKFDQEQFEKILQEMIDQNDNGRVPLWMVALVAGIAALGLLTLFFFGAYSGLGSSL